MELRAQIATFAQVAAGVDANEQVPTCPEWRMRDLVGHMGQAPRWAAEILRTGTPTPPPDPRDADPGPPQEWTNWLLAGADELLAAVALVGANTTVWTIAGPKPAGWWVRRLLADLVVHTADAAITADTPFRVPVTRAADTISEGLELLTTLATFEGNREGTIALRPSDGDGWLITRTATGPTWQHGAAPADAVVEGSTQDLLLILTRRQSPDGVTGDHALVTEFLSYTV